MRWRLESSFDKLFLQCIIFIREGYFTGKIERRVKRLYNSIFPWIVINNITNKYWKPSQLAVGKPVGHWQHGLGIGIISRNQSRLWSLNAPRIELSPTNSKIRELTRTQRESRKTARVKRLLSVCRKLRFSQVIHRRWKHLAKKKLIRAGGMVSPISNCLLGPVSVRLA